MGTRQQFSRIAFGKKKQTDIATATAVTDMFSFTKLNASLSATNLGIESDAAEYGKVNEFANQAFATAWDVNIPFEKYGTSQFLTWLWGFALGNVAVTGSIAPYSYTILPMTPTAGLELPYFTYVEQLPGSDLDQMAVGCAIEEFTMTINSGPGRQNCRVTGTIAGSGKLTTPSGITIPATITETLMPAGICTVSILGTDYVANKNIVSVTMGWKNNLLLSDGYYPGSGFQTTGDPTTGQLRGRMEVGVRTPTFTFTARVATGSPEQAALAALTTGTATITLPTSVNDSFSAVWQKMLYKQVSRTDVNGISTIVVSGEPMWHPTNGLVTVTTKTNLGTIAQ